MANLEELLGAVATVAPSMSPTLKKTQPYYAAGVASVPSPYAKPIGGPDSPLTLISHLNSIPLAQAAQALLPGGGVPGATSTAIPGPSPVYGDYNWGDGADFPDEEEAEMDDSDDMSGAGKPAVPKAGRQAVKVVKQKMGALQARVKRAQKSHGATLKGMALCGDLSNLLPPGFVSLPTPTAASAPVDMSAALDAVNTAMNQLQKQYQQLLAQDTQAQGLAQQFANFTPLPGQSYQGFVDMLNNIDANLQQSAADVSSQIDNLNASLDGLNAQLANLQQQQAAYAQEVANVQAQQTQVNTPIQIPQPGPSYSPPDLQYGGGSVSDGYYQDPFASDTSDGGGDDSGDM